MFRWCLGDLILSKRSISTQISFCGMCGLLDHHLNPLRSLTIFTAPTSSYTPIPFWPFQKKTPNSAVYIIYDLFSDIHSNVAWDTAPHVLTHYVSDKNHFKGFWFLVENLSNFVFEKMGVAKLQQHLKLTLKTKRGVAERFQHLLFHSSIELWEDDVEPYFAMPNFWILSTGTYFLRLLLSTFELKCDSLLDKAGLF